MVVIVTCMDSISHIMLIMGLACSRLLLRSFGKNPNAAVFSEAVQARSHAIASSASFDDKGNSPGRFHVANSAETLLPHIFTFTFKVMEECQRRRGKKKQKKGSVFSFECELTEHLLFAENYLKNSIGNQTRTLNRERNLTLPPCLPD